MIEVFVSRVLMIEVLVSRVSMIELLVLKELMNYKGQFKGIGSYVVLNLNEMFKTLSIS